MYTYKNIEESHSKVKAPIINNILNSTYPDATVVLGAQNREDIKNIVTYSGENNIPCYLYDIRESQLNKLPIYEKTYKYIQDLSNIKNTEKILNTLISNNISNPFIYDNLSGSKERLKHNKIFLEFYERTIFYLHNRLSSRRYAYENFIIEKEYPLQDYNSNGIRNFLMLLNPIKEKNLLLAQKAKYYITQVKNTNVSKQEYMREYMKKRYWRLKNEELPYFSFRLENIDF